jgi:HD superfamily phosphohydrolase
MYYQDRVYGKTEINEPTVLELITCPSFQRLKDIDQSGYRPLWVKSDTDIEDYGHNRFDHSIGVYLLLRKHGAPIEEQIAGLIHDVSHSVFSHCIDYVLEAGSEKDQNHQDNLLRSFIYKSEIPGILQKNGFDPEYILDDGNFPLKEKDLPDLCADRIDYCLRDALIFNELDETGKEYFLEKLKTRKKDWVFSDLESARKFGELFLRMNTIYYAGLSSARMFRIVGDYLKYALGKGYISEDDLYTTDKLVLEKIGKFIGKDRNLELLWERMSNRIRVSNNPDDYDAKVCCKSRIIDPLFLTEGKVLRVSEIQKDWADTVVRESKPKEYFLKFEK